MNKQTKYYYNIIIAGLRITVNCDYRYVFQLCKQYLASFDKPDIVVSVAEEIERLKWCTGAQQIELCKASTNVAINPNIAVVEANLILYKLSDLLLNYGIILMHGATIAYQSNCYVFTAKSGTGKSTRAKLWLNEYPESIVVNGDKPFIKITNSEVFACGTPWCGSEGWNTNTMVPLRAIFLLERADEGEPDSVTEISLGKAFPFLLQQTYQPADPEAMCKTIQLLKALEGKVKFYKFRSHPTAESVRLAYETARLKYDA